VQVGLGVPARQAEELDHVGIAEHLQGRRMGLGERGRCLGRLRHAALEQRGLELALSSRLDHFSWLAIRR
jgi:hypothetical protein